MVFDPVEKLSEWILENAFELRSKILVTFVVSWSKTTSKDLIWPIITRENFELKFKSTQTLGTRWYNFETLPQTDDFRRVTVESVHTVQSVDPIARWNAK